MHQSSGACVTSRTSSPPPYTIIPMIPITNDSINDCSWHETCSWAGQPFPTIHNGYIPFENVITTEPELDVFLQSLQHTLWIADGDRYKIFYSVVMRRFRRGHVHVTDMTTSEKNVGIELVCSCCCRYARVEFQSNRRTIDRMVGATLLSFISGCQYTRPGSDDLPQR